MKASHSCARWLACAALIPVFAVSSLPSPAQKIVPATRTSRAASAHGGAIHALFVSDIHFEPFWDPAKVPQLAAAPASRWKQILAAPASADRDAQFEALEQKCHTRGEDTAYPLYASSLRAMQSAAADATFITVSGDLISHSFSCKYQALFPHAEPAAYQLFVEKTTEFVLGQLRQALPNGRVYAALGNNDSDCGDYKLDTHSPFLSALADTIASGLPPVERSDARATFADAGYYSATLPAPLENTRLLVLNDTFMSRRYSACSGKTDAAGAETQISWLHDQLEIARKDHRQVWVMAHIPPGIDPYSTAARLRDVCSGSAPEMFLSSQDLPDLLSQYSDVVSLALFAHTHMDEMRLLRSKSGQQAAASDAIAVKFVPSISPINGNAPSFVVATIDPAHATLADYRVIAAPEKVGLEYKWKEEYDYAATYHQNAFDASALSSLFTGFTADLAGTNGASSAYLRNYYVRDQSAQLRFFWPQYVCALSAYTTADYKSCRCANPGP